jgi:hypothetical protein
MQLGMIGLGGMGANMVRQLMNIGHNCVVFDMSRLSGIAPRLGSERPMSTDPRSPRSLAISTRFKVFCKNGPVVPPVSYNVMIHTAKNVIMTKPSPLSTASAIRR